MRKSAADPCRTCAGPGPGLDPDRWWQASCAQSVFDRRRHRKQLTAAGGARGQFRGHGDLSLRIDGGLRLVAGLKAIIGSSDPSAPPSLNGVLSAAACAEAVLMTRPGAP